MTKIAFVSDAVWPYNKGGKEKRLFDISSRLAGAGFDVHIYTMKWWSGPDTKKYRGLTLHAISPLYPLYSGPRRSVRQGLAFGLACLRLVREDWDVIEVDHMPFFPLFSVKLVCLLKGKPMYATWHEVWGRSYWLQYLGPAGILAHLIEKASVRLPDKIISVSPHTTRRLRRDLPAAAQIVTVPDGIDLDHIRAVKASAKKSDIIFAGRLLSHKHVDTLLRAVSLLKKDFPKIRVMIVGDGPEKNRLHQLASALGLQKNVSFTGFIEDHDRLLSLIKSSSVFALPSTREGFGIVLAESLACGTPVVTVDHPDNAARLLVRHGKNGYLSGSSPASLAQSITSVLKTRSRFDTDSRISQFDWPVIIRTVTGPSVFGFKT